MRILSVVVSLVVSVTTRCSTPRSAHCPPRWWLAHGVRPDGEFECWSPPPPETSTAEYDPLRIVSRIYCTGGSEPVVNLDGSTVSCQARH